MDGDTELGFAEFVMFVVVIKQIEEKAASDPMFAAAAFPRSAGARKFSISDAVGGGGVAASVRGRSDKGKHVSSAEERRQDAGRSLAEVIARSIDTKRIGDRLVHEKRGEAGSAVNRLVARLADELLGAVVGAPEAKAATAKGRGPAVQFEVAAVTAAIAAEESMAGRPAVIPEERAVGGSGGSANSSRRPSPAPGRHPGSSKPLSGVGGLFTEASLSGMAPPRGLEQRSGQLTASTAAASDAAWRKITRMAQADPKGWTRSMEVLFLDIDTDRDGEVRCCCFIFSKHSRTAGVSHQRTTTNGPNFGLFFLLFRWLLKKS